MLTIIDNLNKSNTLTSDSRLVSLGIASSFLTIDNISGLKPAKNFSDTRQSQFDLWLALLTLLNYAQNLTNLILITNIFYRVTIQYKVLVFHIVIAILPSNILM